MYDSLTKLYVEVTAACNLDCVMCVRRVWNEPLGVMPRERFALMVDQLRSFPSMPTIHMSGYGEPTTHPHFLDLVGLAKDAGARVEITTNGTLLDADMAEALFALDLDRLVVSIDGASADRFEEIREPAGFNRVVDNLRRLKAMRIRRSGRHGNPQLALAFVAMRGNVDELQLLPALAAQVGAWEIIVSNVVPHTAEMEEEVLYSRSMSSCAYRGSRWAPELSLPKLDVEERTLAPLQGAFNSIASISLQGNSLSARNDYCRFAREGYAAVRWDGEVSPCLSLLHDHPEYIRGRRKEITHHSFGNFRDHSIFDIWRSGAFTEYRRRLREFPYSPCTTCGGCNLFLANAEDCSGNGFPTCGGCLWAQGFVQCA